VHARLQPLAPAREREELVVYRLRSTLNWRAAETTR